MKKTATLTLLVALFSAILGVFFGRELFPRIIDGETHIEYRDGPIRYRDTTSVVDPVVRIIYETVHDTVLVEKTVYVPRGFSMAGAISAHPIRFSRGDVILTYFAPDSARFIQDYYHIRPARMDYFVGPTLLFEAFSGLPGLGVDAEIRYERLTAFARAGVLTDGIPVLTLGLRLNLFKGQYR